MPTTALESPPEAAGGRARLLDAAAVEFCQNGYAGASIAAIARRAGISKSTIFHHFASKEALYLAVISSAAEEFRQKLENVLASSAEPGEALAVFQRSHLDHLHRNRQVARLVLRELQSEASSERTVAMVSDVLAANYRRLRDYLEQARREGSIRQDADCDVAALLVFAANVFFFQNRTVLERLPGPDLGSDPHRYADAVADVVFAGLQNQSAE